MSAAEAWSIAASIVSVVLAVLAIILSIWFFILAKNSEKDVAGSLAKIETQAESLQKLNARWMDRLTRFVTEERPRPAEESIPQLIAILAQLPQTLTASLTQTPQRETQEQLVQVRFPHQTGHRFRGKPATQSGAIRPPLRSKPATPLLWG